MINSLYEMKSKILGALEKYIEEVEKEILTELEGIDNKLENEGGEIDERIDRLAQLTER